MILENTPTIETERLILRRFTENDKEDLFVLLCNVEVNTFLPWFPLQNIEETKDFLKNRFLDYYTKPSIYRYAICLNTDNKPIGYVGISDNDSNDLGYALRKEFWGKGIITEASIAVIERLKHAGYSYITATHDVLNNRSGEVMKRLGMNYKYSYIERVQPKNDLVTFRMYQMNFDENKDYTYMKYWDTYQNGFIEENI